MRVDPRSQRRRLSPSARAVRSIALASSLGALTASACGGKSDGGGADPVGSGMCDGGDCVAKGGTGGDASPGGGAGTPAAGGTGGTAVPEGGTGGSSGSSTGGVSGSGVGGAVAGAAGAFSAGTAGIAGTGGAPPEPPPPEPPPPGVACGGEQCDVTIGEVCCWNTTEDSYTCATTCPAGSSTFECDDDSDCPGPGDCLWQGEGHYYQEPPYHTECAEDLEESGHLQCYADGHCDDGRVCCAYLGAAYIQPSDEYLKRFMGTACVLPEECPSSSEYAPFCTTDADCRVDRKCVDTPDWPSSIRTCSALADDVEPTLIDCGDFQCIRDLGQVCSSSGAHEDYLTACRVRSLGGAGVLDCDEHADCDPGESCYLRWHGGENNTICAAEQPWAYYPIQCKTDDDCPDGDGCYVRVTNITGVEFIECGNGGFLYYPRCRTTADCAEGTECIETDMASVGYCD